MGGRLGPKDAPKLGPCSATATTSWRADRYSVGRDGCARRSGDLGCAWLARQLPSDCPDVRLL